METSEPIRTSVLYVRIFFAWMWFGGYAGLEAARCWVALAPNSPIAPASQAPRGRKQRALCFLEGRGGCALSNPVTAA